MGDANKNSPMDGAYGGTYCAPMWAKFFAAALKDEPHPSFKTAPWTFGNWHGKMQAMSPSASPSGSPSASASAKPTAKPTKTITPQPTPTKTKTPTPQPTPTKTKTPKPTPTPTGTPTAGAKKLVALLATPTRTQGVVAGTAATTTGTGDAGLAGSLVDWFAGVLGL